MQHKVALLPGADLEALLVEVAGHVGRRGGHQRVPARILLLISEAEHAREDVSAGEADALSRLLELETLRLLGLLGLLGHDAAGRRRRERDARARERRQRLGLHALEVAERSEGRRVAWLARQAEAQAALGSDLAGSARR